MSEARHWRGTSCAVQVSRDQPFVIIDKNLCNYPLARDKRTSTGIKWTKGKKTGDWLAPLPGDARITLRLPQEVKDRRAPTAFDMNVLFLLLAEARRTNHAEIEFRSHTEILKALRYGVDAENLRRVGAALTLWSCLTIKHHSWYFPKTALEKARHGMMRLPPPITKVRLRDGVRITINGAWLRRSSAYWEKVPLPLPRQAPAQNLVLCLLTSISYGDVGDDGSMVSWKRTIRQLCRKLGLNHTTRNRVLARSIAEAENWFTRQAGHLTNAQRDGQIVFVISKANRGRSRTSTPRVKLEAHVLRSSPSTFRAVDDDGNEYNITEFADGSTSEETAWG
jgi:hypothetical protein